MCVRDNHCLEIRISERKGPKAIMTDVARKRKEFSIPFCVHGKISVRCKSN